MPKILSNDDFLKLQQDLMAAKATELEVRTTSAEWLSLYEEAERNIIALQQQVADKEQARLDLAKACEQKLAEMRCSIVRARADARNAQQRAKRLSRQLLKVQGGPLAENEYHPTEGEERALEAFVRLGQ